MGFVNKINLDIYRNSYGEIVLVYLEEQWVMILKGSIKF